jgi:hypothetical protein
LPFIVALLSVADLRGGRGGSGVDASSVGGLLVVVIGRKSSGEHRHDLAGEVDGLWRHDERLVRQGDGEQQPPDPQGE